MAQFVEQGGPLGTQSIAVVATCVWAIVAADVAVPAERGVDVPTHTVRAGLLDLSTPSGRMVARQLGAVAQYESEHKSDRVRRARLQAAQHGEPQGGPRSRSRAKG